MNKPLGVIVNGAKGKMGSMAVDTLAEHSDFELVAQLHRGDDLAQAIIDTKPSIIVDLTSAESVYNNTIIAIEHGIHPVIGASGLLENDISHLKQLCEEKALGAIIVPNFSIAAVLMMHFASLASKWFSEVEIIEAHHQNKLDAPSGTALKTAEMIANTRKNPKNGLPLKELIPGVRGGTVQDINIHSLRLPGILARQQVIFGSTGETLSITHESIDRTSFMPGIVLACQKVSSLKKLYYGLEHLL
jgi:4-hydroxy-tetrahydrodipicolinate reductase